jgi:hypothetical protein
MQATRPTQLGLLPTTIDIYIERMYAGNPYARLSMIFGEKEYLRLTVRLTSGILPVINVPVKVYLDERQIATIITDGWGVAQLTFPNGIPKGNHTIKCVFEGDFWHSPAESSRSLKTVGMHIAYFKSYVESLAAASPSTIEFNIVDSLLKQEIGVVPIKTEADTERIRYIYTMLIPEEDTSGKTTAMVDIGTIIAIIIIAIVAIYALYTINHYITIVYEEGYYTCGVCGARFTTCEALREHLISQHPDIWEKIKNNFECAPPPSPFPQPLQYIIYAVIGVAGAILIIELIKAIRR